MIDKLKMMLVVTLLTIPTAIKKDNFKVFEKEYISLKIKETAKTIAKLAPDLSIHRQISVAKAIQFNSAKYGIPEHLLVSIIKIESNFKSEKISNTGDYSIVQINLNIWNREFKRLGLAKIDKFKLVKNDDYAVAKMCVILNIIKSRNKKDKKWYARYHSNTPEHNAIYVSKINKVMKLIASR